MNNKYISTNHSESLDIDNDTILRRKINELREEKTQIDKADFFFKTLLCANQFHNTLKDKNINPTDIEVEISEYRKNDNIYLKASVILLKKSTMVSKTQQLAYDLSRDLTSNISLFCNPDYSNFSKDAKGFMNFEEYFTLKFNNDDYKDSFLKSFLNDELYKTYLSMSLDNSLDNKTTDTLNKKKAKI